MQSVRINSDISEQVEAFALDSSGTPVTGLSDVLLAVRRVSDGYYYDFNDSTFKGSGWTTRQQVMSEIDATNDAGLYGYLLNTTGFSEGSYQLRAESATGHNFPQFGELKVGEWPDKVASSNRVLRNKMTSNTLTSKVESWNDAGTDIVESWPMTDKDGNSVVLTGTGPANRGVPS